LSLPLSEVDAVQAARADRAVVTAEATLKKRKDTIVGMGRMGETCNGTGRGGREGKIRRG
jgi:hypothetical protein